MFNKLAADVFNARLTQANLVAKTDFDNKVSNLNRKITKNKPDHLLVQNELKKLKIFDFGYFIGKSHFEEGGAQYYLVFQPIVRYFKFINNTDYISYFVFIMSMILVLIMMILRLLLLKVFISI